MSEIHELSALELAAVVRSGEVSPAEVTEHTLDRAERLGPGVGAFVHVAADLAREQASRAATLLADSRGVDAAALPPFLGVPVPIKDNLMVAGLPFRGGSAALNLMPTVDDGVVTLLREAGTIMVGKTNLPELGLPPYTEPDIAPPARSPWDTHRTAGGSSGGAAAAVAAGIVPAAHGNDGGGSLRIPASACGLVGLKVSRGRISPGPYGVDGVGLSTNGVLTRTVRDTAAFLDVLARPWPGETFHLPDPTDTFLAACEREPGPLRIGVLTDPIAVDGVPVHAEVLAGVARAGRLLEQLGHHLQVIPPPFSAQDWDAFGPLWAVGALQAPIPPEAESALLPLTRWLRERGRGVSGAEYADALAALQRLTRRTAGAWAGLDVILSPTLAQPAAPIGSIRDDADPAGDFAAQKAFTPWTSTWNIIGAPSISLPLHRAEVDGIELPFGVMLGGRTGDEETLLSLAATLEAADPWPAFPPGT